MSVPGAVGGRLPGKRGDVADDAKGEIEILAVDGVFELLSQALDQVFDLLLASARLEGDKQRFDVARVFPIRIPSSNARPGASRCA